MQSDLDEIDIKLSDTEKDLVNNLLDAMIGSAPKAFKQATEAGKLVLGKATSINRERRNLIWKALFNAQAGLFSRVEKELMAAACSSSRKLVTTQAIFSKMKEELPSIILENNTRLTPAEAKIVLKVLDVLIKSAAEAEMQVNHAGGAVLINMEIGRADTIWLALKRLRASEEKKLMQDSCSPQITAPPIVPESKPAAALPVAPPPPALPPVVVPPAEVEISLNYWDLTTINERVTKELGESPCNLEDVTVKKASNIIAQVIQAKGLLKSVPEDLLAKRIDEAFHWKTLPYLWTNNGNVVPVADCKVYPPNEVKFKLSFQIELTPGQKAIVQIKGDNLGQVESVDPPLGSLFEKILKDIAPIITNTSISYPEFLVPADAAPGKYTFTLKDHAGKILCTFEAVILKDEDREVGPTAQKLKLEMSVGAGGLVEVSGGGAKLSDAAVENRTFTRNLDVHLQLAPNLVGPNGFWRNGQKSIEVGLNGSFDYWFTSHQKDSDSAMIGGSIGAHVASYPSRFTDPINLYFNYDGDKADYANPTARFFSGSQQKETVGLSDTLSLPAGIKLKLFLESTWTQAALDSTTLGFPFDDSGSYIRSGGKLTLPVDQWLKAKYPNLAIYAPILEFSGSSIYGNHMVPERIGSTELEPSKETINIWDLGGKVAWGETFFLTLKYTNETFGGWWDPEKFWNATASLMTTKTGKLQLDSVIYPDRTFVFNRLHWNLPNWGKAADLFNVLVEYDYVNGVNAIGGSIGVDFARLFTQKIFIKKH